VVLASLLLSGLLSGCGKDGLKSDPNADAQGHTQATDITAQTNAKVREELPFHDQSDFENAKRGFIAKDADLVVKNVAGEKIWDQPGYEFIRGEAPDSANPSLWRQEKLNNIHGLFKVADGLYQIRGYDLANMSIIKGKTGWIIVDPLTCRETAQKALALVRKNLGDKPVTAILFTHSHIDHFGGALGIMDQDEAKAKKIPIIAPKGFMKEATSENIIAGIAMGRRSMYMYGKDLARSPRGQIGVGLGKGPAYGTFGILEPNRIVDHTGQKMRIDGVNFIFQYTPDSEAPAELTFYLPESKAFCGAEIVSCNMHNLYTLRGTKVRDAVKWSAYIEEARTLFHDAQIYFGSHHWPRWGNETIMTFLETQRDTYKYIHDQTVRLFNRGYTPIEIAEKIKLPPSLASTFSSRGYYGTLSHNAKAVYQAYLGWYDGNPANLNPLPPVQAATRYVELMGGGKAVIANARSAFERGEYRWTAQLLNHLVFADPDNTEARALLARTYDQLGYQSESGAWRNAYLSGAYELRHGKPEKGLDMAILKGVLEKTPVSYFFDSMSVRLNGPKAQGKEMMVKIHFTDLDEIYILRLKNGVLHHKRAEPGSDIRAEANVTIKVSHELFVRMLVGQAGIKDTIFSDDLTVEGSKLDLVRFLLLFDKPDGLFSIVTP